MLDYPEYLKMLLGLIAIVNPIGGIPIFISLTTGMSNIERNRVALMAVYTVTGLFLLSLFIGESLLQFFGISISSFRVAGGLLLLLMAISMMHAEASGLKRTDEELKEGSLKDSVAVVPLGTPLLAGPGAMSTIILYAHRGHGLGHTASVSGILLVTCLTIWLVLKMVPVISRHISQTGINVFTRIMGLILASIAIEFIANGLKGLFPGLT